MKKILIILLLIITVGCSNKEVIINDEENKVDNGMQINENENNSQISDEPINIYLFWGSTCHACANLKEFFNELDDSYNKYFNLKKYEVWYNEENKKLMYEVGEFLNQTYYAVPFLVVGDEVIVGFNESKKEYILDKIIEEYNNDRYDVMEKLNN